MRWGRGRGREKSGRGDRIGKWRRSRTGTEGGKMVGEDGRKGDRREGAGESGKEVEGARERRGKWVGGDRKVGTKGSGEVERGSGDG